jgi:putative heme-binding domain-containing protein
MGAKDYFPRLLGDPSPAVRRELAVALREDAQPGTVDYWKALAIQFDGKDRWYLEALGIAAMERWDECLTAWKESLGSKAPDAAYQKIVWRARGAVASQLQAQLLQNPKFDGADIPAMFRALDLQDPEHRTKALRMLLKLASDHPGKDKMTVEALMRLDGVDVNADPELSNAARRYLATISNDSSQLKIIRKLQVSGLTDQLIDRAIAWGATTNAVQALDLAVEQGSLARIMELVSVTEPDERASALAKVLTLSNRKDVQDELASSIGQEDVSKSLKVDAAVSLSRSKAMHGKLIELAKAGKLPAESFSLIGASLRSSTDETIKQAAQDLFPTAKTSQAPLSPLEVLVKKVGNAANGKMLYNGVATCSQCHMVGTEGKNVGPSLTEIGNKLSKDAMYISILAPSAGISHNFESFAVRTTDDEIITGLLVSQTTDNVTIKDSKGIERTIDRKDIEELKKQEKSLMPENLQETMDEQGLVDLVEYLTTLKK